MCKKLLSERIKKGGGEMLDLLPFAILFALCYTEKNNVMGVSR